MPKSAVASISFPTELLVEIDRRAEEASIKRSTLVSECVAEHLGAAAPLLERLHGLKEENEDLVLKLEETTRELERERAREKEVVYVTRRIRYG